MLQGAMPVIPLLVAVPALFVTLTNRRFVDIGDRQSAVLALPLTIEGSRITLDEALGSVARQLRANIVCDDPPHSREAALNEKGNAKDVLDVVAARFDCSWTLAEPNSIVFRRLYHDPADFPQVTVKEQEATVRSILALLQAIGPAPDSRMMPVALRQLYTTLTPLQRDISKSGEGIQVRELSRDQQSLVRSAIYHNTLGGFAMRCECLLSQLKGLESARLQVGAGRTAIQSDQPAGQPGSTGMGDATRFTWLSEGFREQVFLPHLRGLVVRTRGVTATGRPRARPLVKRGSRNAGRAPSRSPAISDSLLAILGNTKVRSLAPSMSLSSILSQLSMQVGRAIRAESSIEDRRVSVFAVGLPASQALDLLCNVNGWVWYETDGNAVEVAPAYLKQPRDFVELADTIRMALPPRWLRYLSQVPEEQTNPLDEASKGSGVFDQKAMTAHIQGRLAVLTQRFGIRVKGAIGQHGENGTEIRFEAMSPEERTDVVTCLVLDFYEQLFGGSGDATLLLGKMLPFQRDPGSAFLRLKDNGIAIDSIELKNGMRIERGFGASIQ